MSGLRRKLHNHDSPLTLFRLDQSPFAAQVSRSRHNSPPSRVFLDRNTAASCLISLWNAAFPSHINRIPFAVDASFDARRFPKVPLTSARLAHQRGRLERSNAAGRARRTVDHSKPASSVRLLARPLFPRAIASGSSAQKASDHHTTIPFFVAQPSASAINSAISTSTAAPLNANNFHPGFMLSSLFVVCVGGVSCVHWNRTLGLRLGKLLPNAGANPGNGPAKIPETGRTIGSTIAPSASLAARKLANFCISRPAGRARVATPSSRVILSSDAGRRLNSCASYFTAGTASLFMMHSWTAARRRGGSIINAACGSPLLPSASSARSNEIQIPKRVRSGCAPESIRTNAGCGLATHVLPRHSFLVSGFGFGQSASAVYRDRDFGVREFTGSAA